MQKEERGHQAEDKAFAKTKRSTGSGQKFTGAEGVACHKLGQPRRKSSVVWGLPGESGSPRSPVSCSVCSLHLPECREGGPLQTQSPILTACRSPWPAP